jgi:hypothetical protein
VGTIVGVDGTETVPVGVGSDTFVTSRVGVPTPPPTSVGDVGKGVKIPTVGTLVESPPPMDVHADRVNINQIKTIRFKNLIKFSI